MTNKQFKVFLGMLNGNNSFKTHFKHTLFFFFLQNNLDYVDPQIANLLFEAGQSSTNIIYNI